MPDSNATPVNVVVVFYSRYGETEQLALAAGVGAIQAHANIRVRRLKDLADSEAIERDPRRAENLERMNRDYIAPREIDVNWAEVILVASCPDSPRETEKYLVELLATPDRNDRMLIVPLVDNSSDTQGDRLTSAREQARKAVEDARKLKT